jgi:hypothetical protein
MTVETGQAALPPDPLASQRGALLGQLLGAQFDLERAIAALVQSGASTVAADAQLRALTGLQARIGTASPSELRSLTAEIASAVLLAQQAASTAQNEAVAERGSNLAANIVQAAAEAHDAMHAAIDHLRDFDPYLHFASAADEAAYRQREAERLAYIKAQEAKHTPEGELNASGAAVGQMVDAKAHGAGASPAFQERADNLVRAAENLREQVRASGGSTKEFDDRLREDVRRILKSKGLSDAEIDAQFAAHHGSALEVAKSYLHDGRDLRALEIAATRADKQLPPQDVSVEGRRSPTSVDVDTLANAAALLKASGVTVTVPTNSSDPAHGVTTQVRSPQPAVQLG